MKKGTWSGSAEQVKISLSVILVPFVIFSINQLLLQLLKPAEQSLAVKLRFAAQPSIYILFTVTALVLVFFVSRILSPLYRYLLEGSQYDKARRASLTIPWLLILTNTGLWLVVVTFFYAIQGFRTPGGVPYFWSLTTNSISGGIAAILSALLINRILLPAKMALEMTDIRAKERDYFSRFKIPLIIISGFLYTVLLVGYAAEYFIVSYREGITVTLPGFEPVLGFIAFIIFIPLMLNTWLARSEDRIQSRFLLDKMKDLTVGSGDLARKVNLLNFDDTGELAAVINSFIDKIRSLIITVEETGALVLETSTAVGSYLSSLSRETGIMLEAVDSIDESMNTQEQEFQFTRNALLEYFDAIHIISGSINEQTASVEETSSAIEEMAASLKTEHKAAKDVENLTIQLSRITGKGSTYITDFIDSIRQVEDSSQTVEDILDHLDNLAEQVDVLAMNAAIEAAHAGEAGKGFGVVAEEIRKLAENTSAESHEISGHVKTMLETIREGNQKTGLANNAFSEIQENVEMTTSHFHQIYVAIEEETAGIGELLKAVELLVSITERLRDIAETQKVKNESMTDRITTVFNRFATIKQDLNNQRRNKSIIESSLESMQQITQRNLNAVTALQKQLKQFTL